MAKRKPKRRKPRSFTTDLMFHNYEGLSCVDVDGDDSFVSALEDGERVRVRVTEIAPRQRPARKAVK